MRLIDADALRKHQVESDKIKGVLLVVPIGYIINAPTIEPGIDVTVLRTKVIAELDRLDAAAHKAYEQEGAGSRYTYLISARAGLAAFAIAELGLSPSYSGALDFNAV